MDWQEQGGNGAKIVFSGGKELAIAENLDVAEVVRQLGAPSSGPQYLGMFLNLSLDDGSNVWINPSAVAYVTPK